MSVSILEQKVKVRYEDSDTPVIFDCCDVQSMRKQDNRAAKPVEEKAEEPAPKAEETVESKPETEKAEKPNRFMRGRRPHGAKKPTQPKQDGEQK